MVDKAQITNEYNFWINIHYFLPSKQLLTVHTLTQTQLKFLDTFTDKDITRWAGIPRSATNVFINMKEDINIFF